jgi:Exodeoxyribonuclease X-like C-terminal
MDNKHRDLSPLKILTFGEHKGERLGEVAVYDRDYLEWLAEQDWVRPQLKDALATVLGA